MKVKVPPFSTLDTEKERSEKNYSALCFKGRGGEDIWAPPLYVVYIEGVVALPYHTGRNLFPRHGRQQQQQPQQQQPDMIDKTTSKNTSNSTIRSALFRASHQRIKPVHKRKHALIRVFDIRDIKGRIYRYRGRVQGCVTPPPPPPETKPPSSYSLLKFVYLTNQLRGKKNPASALNYLC